MNCAASLGPQADHAGGCDDQERGRPVRPGVRDERQGLDGLAEPHVVGEDPAEPGLPEVGEPAEPGQLVGPQLRLEPDRVDGRQRVQGAERLGRPHPLGGLLVDDAHLGELVPQAQVVVTDPHAALGLLLQLGGRLDQPLQVRELGPVDAQVLAVAQDHPVEARGQRREHVGQRDRGAVDGDLDLQVEPVHGMVELVVAGPLAADEVDDRHAVELAVVGLVADLVDLDLAAQPRQQLGGEQDRVRVAERPAVLQAHPALVPAAEVVLLLGVELQPVEQLAAPGRDGARRAARGSPTGRRRGRPCRPGSARSTRSAPRRRPPR